MLSVETTQVKLILGGADNSSEFSFLFIELHRFKRYRCCAPSSTPKRRPLTKTSQPIIARLEMRIIASLSPFTLFPTTVRDRQLRSNELRNGAGPGGHGLGGVDSEVVGQRPGAGWRGRPCRVCSGLNLGRRILSAQKRGKDPQPC